MKRRQPGALRGQFKVSADFEQSWEPVIGPEGKTATLPVAFLRTQILPSLIERAEQQLQELQQKEQEGQLKEAALDTGPIARSMENIATIARTCALAQEEAEGEPPDEQESSPTNS